jgi:hypothetical protein
MLWMLRFGSGHELRKFDQAIAGQHAMDEELWKK